jgi:N-acetylmuramoyl-L-alanine amidase
LKKEMRGKILFWIIVGALVLGGGLQAFIEQRQAMSTFSAARAAGETVVIDAGHGGEDGGAVTSSGVPESGINLAIALRLDSLLGFYGVQTKVLRTTDISLHDSTAKTLREKKVSDLHNRVATIEATENATLISIHQNKFQSARYHGAQVFYTNEELSLPFAALTQNILKEALDPANTRVPAQIPDNVYLMNHITCRAILVECGFLSNPEEARKLQTPAYQEKIAVALAGSFLQFQGMEPPSTEGELPNEG